MHKHTQLTSDRIGKFLSKIVEPAIYPATVPLTVAAFSCQDPIPVKEAYRKTYKSISQGTAWGPVWSTMWLRMRGKVPKTWSGKEVVALIDTGSEAMIWERTCPMQGLDSNRQDYQLFPSAKGSETVELYVEAAGNHAFGINASGSRGGAKNEEKPFVFKRADLAVFRRDMWNFYCDLKFLYQLLLELPQDQPRYHHLLRACNDAVNAYSPDDEKWIVKAGVLLQPVLKTPAVASAHRISAIGHAHIDTAWLWPLRETKRKCARTFSTAVRYMDMYPAYKFGCSQPQQYQYMKDNYPELYEKIKAKVKAKQWEPIGSMWIETDCNLASGESLVRQILHGKRFFMEEFGVETIDLWMPDVFGYSAALPQILIKSGIKYFVTQKISWNQFNKFPHHTFYWQGIDGTRIFSHFLPADTYNARLNPKELVYNVKNYKDHARCDRSLYVYGFGDGGGGPTREMLENAIRARNIEGSPRVEQEFVRNFLAKAEAESQDLETWTGELYLELHRGTLTTQARNKRYNRKCEFLLRDAEFLATVQPEGLKNYPVEVLDRSWKTVLLNQFHDIIPGSSIGWVYEDSTRDYEQVRQEAGGALESCAQKIANSIDTAGMAKPVVAFNQLGHARTTTVMVPLEKDEEPTVAVDLDGNLAPVQIVRDAGKTFALFLNEFDSMSYDTLDLQSKPRGPEYEHSDLRVRNNLLENDLLKVQFDSQGLITSLFDKRARREVLAPGRLGNEFQFFGDQPNNWDAWDIDIFYQEKALPSSSLVSAQVVERGPVRAAIKFVRKFRNSIITQYVQLVSGSPRLNFVTQINWKEAFTLLKVAFPVDVNSPRATYEIQYGHLERPTHYNTSWDMARFEVCGHKWADLSEANYGVALLNDCKYGHDIHQNVMRLTLLRSPKHPDQNADMGDHSFTYSLIPHAGDFRAAGVIDQAYDLNCPIIATRTTAHRGSLPLEYCYLRVNQPNIMLEVFKKAETENAVIVRLYEAFNQRGSCTITTTLPVKRVFACNLIEKNEHAVPFENGKIRFDYRPFEIVTFKLVM